MHPTIAKRGEVFAQWNTVDRCHYNRWLDKVNSCQRKLEDHLATREPFSANQQPGAIPTFH